MLVWPQTLFEEGMELDVGCPWLGRLNVAFAFLMICFPFGPYNSKAFRWDYVLFFFGFLSKSK